MANVFGSPRILLLSTCSPSLLFTGPCAEVFPINDSARCSPFLTLRDTNTSFFGTFFSSFFTTITVLFFFVPPSDWLNMLSVSMAWLGLELLFLSSAWNTPLVMSEEHNTNNPGRQTVDK
jgi:hypothetical protein